MEEVAVIESKSGHAYMRQSGRGGAVSIYWSQEYQVQHEEFCVVSTKNSTTTDLNVTSAYDTMSVDNTDDELVLIRSPIETSKPSSKPTTAT